MRQLFLAGAALLFAAPAAWAQAERAADFGPTTGDREVTLSGSGSSDNELDNTTLGVSGSYGFYTTPNLLFGLRQSVNYTGIDDADDAFNGSTRGFVDYVFGTGRLRPFVGASLGAVYGDNVEESVAVGPEAGVKYYADRNTFVFGQVEYQILFEDSSEFDNNIDDGIFNYTIGVGFNF